MMDDDIKTYFKDSVIRKFFTSSICEVALRVSNIGQKHFEAVNSDKFVDLKKATGHMNKKQLEYLRIFGSHHLHQLFTALKFDSEIALIYMDNF